MNKNYCHSKNIEYDLFCIDNQIKLLQEKWEQKNGTIRLFNESRTGNRTTGS